MEKFICTINTRITVSYYVIMMLVKYYYLAFGEPSVFTGHKTSINCLEFSHGGLTLASGGRDSVIVLWDILGEVGLFSLKGHKATITQIQFTLDDKFLVSR